MYESVCKNYVKMKWNKHLSDKNRKIIQLLRIMKERLLTYIPLGP